MNEPAIRQLLFVNDDPGITCLDDCSGNLHERRGIVKVRDAVRVNNVQVVIPPVKKDDRVTHDEYPLGRRTALQSSWIFPTLATL